MVLPAHWSADTFHRAPLPAALIGINETITDTLLEKIRPRINRAGSFLSRPTLQLTARVCLSEPSFAVNTVCSAPVTGVTPSAA